MNMLFNDNKRYMSNIYLNDPASFDEFSIYEDSAKNLCNWFNTEIDFRGCSVLDIGAGTGRFSFYIMDQAREVICTDTSEKMVAYLNDIIIKRNLTDKCHPLICDHLLLPFKLKNRKFDYIIAGYTLSSYFTDETICDESKRQLFCRLLSGLLELLNDIGKIIIVETAGIRFSDGTCKLLEIDNVLVYYFELLNHYATYSKVIETDFHFDKRDDARRVISKFWPEALNMIRYDDILGKYVLHESSKIWIIRK